mmetsp:Transcript_37858/g.45646  ORF Transcript_37858/g.45646 Transcript_37858/m.45646 type:complete len:430 (+) Transcript_37858:194-1483(+)|eukprot:CAMPEP_0197849582 /NCGR_PEP_ID=MMETSP1438-20131217/12660_1 /TAXON_ID=1461541 /ORGANISM="Pterosperma sp., Strain CCMP1384" /LENGTH=429 /DNA_ID=CAMNT_0043462347 /DNA_START=192 /DNA_END=1481 /DNA_ORIENTATION=+
MPVLDALRNREKWEIGLLVAVPAVPLAYQVYKWHNRTYRPGAFSGYLASLLQRHSQARRATRPFRVYLDGCFDMMHYGHANAIRQAKACGDVLVLGLIDDDEIERCKGPPVMNQEERLKMVESVKWVDEVLTGVPYELTEDFMKTLFEKHNIDVIVHGDDPCLLPDGTDAYAACKRMGKFKTIKRTEGVSTTDIVGRMLMCSTRPPKSPLTQMSPDKQHTVEAFRETSNESASASLRASLSQFLPTSRRFVQFSSGRQAPPGATVVYLDGAFDMFHAGHVEILKKAKGMGDFLLVGVHPDEVVSGHRGRHHPIMDLHERSLSVLACRYVDEVIIGAPWEISRDMITTFNISTVVHGTCGEVNRISPKSDPYMVPKKMGIFREITSPMHMTTSDIITRIVDNQKMFEEKFNRKNASENTYIENKEFIEEL